MQFRNLELVSPTTEEQIKYKCVGGGLLFKECERECISLIIKRSVGIGI